MKVSLFGGVSTKKEFVPLTPAHPCYFAANMKEEKFTHSEPIILTNQEIFEIKLKSHESIDFICESLNILHNRHLENIKNNKEMYLNNYFDNSFFNEKIEKEHYYKFFLKEINHFTPTNFYELLINVPKVSSSNLNTFVLSDADGSVARIILLAIQSGHVTFKNKDGLWLLAEVLYEEYKFTGIKPHYFEFFHGKKLFVKENFLNNNFTEIIYRLVQSNELLAKKYENLLSCVQFSQRHFRLICMGDIIFDRLTCHQSMTIEFIRQFHDHGVIFIKGNHDSVDVAKYDKDSKHMIGLNGCYGKYCVDHGFKSDNFEELFAQWIEFENLVFKNSFYDKEKKIFFIHNGLEVFLDKDGCFVLLSAFHPHPDFFRGELSDYLNKRELASKFMNQDPQFLESYLNQNFLNDNTASEEYGGVNTNFRPDREKMKYALDYLFPKQGIRLMHGHSGVLYIPDDLNLADITKTESEVISLNSRQDTQVGLLSNCALHF